jgi:hypothetical protein
LKHCTAIGCKIKALRHQPLGAKSKHHATSHWAQNQSITPPAIRHKIEALRRQPSSTNSKHRATIRGSTSASRRHRALIISIVLPLGTSFKYHTTIGHFFQALHHCALI